MNHVLSFVLVLASLLAQCTPARAASPTPLAAIPDSALLVGRVADPNRTVEDVRNFVRRIDQQLGRLLPPLPPDIQSVISSPLFAETQQRDWWFALLLPKRMELPPQYLLIVPTTRHDETVDLFRQIWPGGQSEQVEVIDCSPWIVLTDPGTAGDVRACLAGEAKSLGSSLSLRSQAMLEKGQVGLCARVDVIRTDPRFIAPPRSLPRRLSSHCRSRRRT